MSWFSSGLHKPSWLCVVVLLVTGQVLAPIGVSEARADYQLVWLPTPQLNSGDRHGGSVAISDLGETIIAGAEFDSFGGLISQGSAVVYHRSGSGWSVDEVLLDPAPATDAYFGASVAIDGAGDTAVVGSYSQRVVVFEKGSQGWEVVEVMTPGCGGRLINTEFGREVAISGDGSVVAVACNDGVLLAGLGINGVGPSQFVTIPGATIPSNRYPYWSIDLSGDGSVLAVGNPGRGVGGSVTLFRRASGSWSLESELTRASASSGEDLGQQVELSSDGSVISASLPYARTLVAGEVANGGVQSWVFSGQTWSELSLLQPPYSDWSEYFGNSIAATGDSNNLFVSYGISNRWFKYHRSLVGWILDGEMPSGGWVLAAGASSSHVAIGSPYSSGGEVAAVTELATQSITFTAVGIQLLGAKTVALSATASSSLAVAFTSATRSVCTVSGSTVKMLKTGDCTIKANQAGGSGWDAAPQVSRTFAIRLSPLLTLTKTVAATSIAQYAKLTIKTGSVVSLKVSTQSARYCKVSKSTLRGLKVGSCTVTVTVKPKIGLSASRTVTLGVTR